MFKQQGKSKDNHLYRSKKQVILLSLIRKEEDYEHVLMHLYSSVMM